MSLDGESDGVSVVSGEVPDVEVVKTSRSSGNSVVTRSPSGFEMVGGDEDSSSFFERAPQECNAHRHDRGHV